MVSPDFYFVNSCSLGGLTQSPGWKPLLLVLCVQGSWGGGGRQIELLRTRTDSRLRSRGGAQPAEHCDCPNCLECCTLGHSLPFPMRPRTELVTTALTLILRCRALAGRPSWFFQRKGRVLDQGSHLLQETVSLSSASSLFQQTRSPEIKPQIYASYATLFMANKPFQQH